MQNGRPEHDPLLNACRRVTDWANPLASSSNLLFITFLSFCFILFVFCFTADFTDGADTSHAEASAIRVNYLDANPLETSRECYSGGMNGESSQAQRQSP